MSSYDPQTFPLAFGFAICKQSGMESTDLYDQLRGIGVSNGYASQIANGRRTPSLSLAIRIYRRLGVKLGPIAQASRHEIETLEKVGAKRVTQ